MFAKLFLLFLLLAIGACSKGIILTRTIASPGGVSAGNATDDSIVFSGIASISDKSDSTITLHWPSHASAVAYDIYDGDNYLRAVDGQGSTQTTLTGLTPSQTYNFKVRLKTSLGLYDNNTVVIPTQMNAGPNIPDTLTLLAPVSSPGITGTPTIRITGTKNGDTVKLYTDAACTNEVASGPSTGGRIDLTTTLLPPGSYTLYAQALGASSAPSGCSAANVAYSRVSCPAGYILVPNDSGVGTNNDFCVAKYEMKNVSGNATSQANGTPWVSISQTNAIASCEALNSLNGVSNKYALISNAEWMTVARNVELIDSNWSPVSGVQLSGVGVLARGHSDASPSSAQAAGNDNDPYFGTSNNDTQAGNSGWEQRRTLTLSNGEVIWDFSGNVWEWVDWNVTPSKKAYQNGTNISTDQGSKEWLEVNRKIGEDISDEMLISTWASSFIEFSGGIPDPVNSLNKTSGIGSYYAGTNSNGGAALRGGDLNLGNRSGAFTLDLSSSAGYTYSSIGFRCVYRP